MLRFKSICVGSFVATLFLLFMSVATPAHAQSLEDQAAAAQTSTVVSNVQAPVAQEPSMLHPRLSFQALGSNNDWHLYVDANLHAYHFDRDAVHKYGFNENNFGGGLEFTNDVLGVMAGYYHNSIWRGSLYVLGRYSPLQLDLTSKDRLNAGFVFGGLSGYTEPTYGNGYRIVQEPAANGELMPNIISARVVTGQRPRGFMPAAGALLSYEHDHAFGLNLIFVPNFRSAGIYGFMGIQARIGIPDRWW